MRRLNRLFLLPQSAGRHLTLLQADVLVHLVMGGLRDGVLVPNDGATVAQLGVRNAQYGVHLVGERRRMLSDHRLLGLPVAHRPSLRLARTLCVLLQLQVCVEACAGRCPLVLSHRELRVLRHAVLVVVELYGHVFVPVCSHVGALLAAFLHALHLVAVDELLLLIVDCHLAIHRPFLHFVRHHAGLTVVELAVALPIVANPGRHLVVVRLMNHRVVVCVSLARVECALVFRIQCLVYVQ